MVNNTVLVLGANGFIGSHLVDNLAKKDYHVRAFGRFENKPIFNSSKNIELFKGDFLNQYDIEKSLKDVSFVVHLISTTTPATSDKDPLIDLSTNVSGSVSLFQKCIENSNIKKIIFASSGGTVYGDNYLGRPYKESDSTRPISPYGIGKLSIENYLRYYNKAYGLNYNVFRISNPYGGRQRNTKKQGLIPLLVNNIYDEIPITIYGDGSMIRDYIYINDLIDVISNSLDRDLKHHTYNISYGKGTSINNLVKIIENITNKKAIIEHKDTPSSFVHTSILDNNRILSEVGINLTSLRNGLDEYIEQFTKHR